MAPIDISSVHQWNTILRDAKAANPPQTVVVDWFATWCGPCKAIAPYFDQIAEKNPKTIFVRVDVDGPGTRVIAQKYQISAMPTFTAIQNGEVVDRLQGADPRGLAAMVQKHATPLTPSLPTDAEYAKAEGNKAFVSGDYHKAIEAYSKAIQHAPKSAVLYANRSFSYLKLAQQTKPDAGRDRTLLPNAVQDAYRATELDDHYSKAWVRLAEALLYQSEDMDDLKESSRPEGVQNMKAAAKEALENAARLAEKEGNARFKAEVEHKLAAINV